MPSRIDTMSLLCYPYDPLSRVLLKWPLVLGHIGHRANRMAPTPSCSEVPHSMQTAMEPNIDPKSLGSLGIFGGSSASVSH